MFDLFCGLGGATAGFLAEGFRCIGIDNERHRYGDHCYPSQLWIQDILTVDGAQLRDADFLWASPPCFIADTLILTRHIARTFYPRRQEAAE
jgi:site-specific DNA-cytosine methylase